jgi:hypothetical protein
VDSPSHRAISSRYRRDLASRESRLANSWGRSCPRHLVGPPELRRAAGANSTLRSPSGRGLLPVPPRIRRDPGQDVAAPAGVRSRAAPPHRGRPRDRRGALIGARSAVPRVLGFVAWVGLVVGRALGQRRVVGPLVQHRQWVALVGLSEGAQQFGQGGAQSREVGAAGADGGPNRSQPWLRRAQGAGPGGAFGGPLLLTGVAAVTGVLWPGLALLAVPRALTGRVEAQRRQPCEGTQPSRRGCEACRAVPAIMMD